MPCVYLPGPAPAVTVANTYISQYNYIINGWSHVYGNTHVHKYRLHMCFSLVVLNFNVSSHDTVFFFYSCYDKEYFISLCLTPSNTCFEPSPRGPG